MEKVSGEESSLKAIVIINSNASNLRNQNEDLKGNLFNNSSLCLFLLGNFSIYISFPYNTLHPDKQTILTYCFLTNHYNKHGKRL